MKNTWKRIFALCLCLVMVAVLLPVSPAGAAIVTIDGIVLVDEDFSGYADVSELEAGGIFTNINENHFSIGDYDSDGKKELRVETVDSTTRNLLVTVPLNLPAKTDDMIFYLKVEVDIVHETDGGYYLVDIHNGSSTGVGDVAANFKLMTSGNYVSDNGTTHLEGNTGTVTMYYRVDAASTVLGARLGMHKNGNAGSMLIKGYRITLLPAVCVYRNDTFESTFVTNMAYKDAYVKLSQNLILPEDLILGENAVLDLNGYTVTVAEGTKVEVGTNAHIVDYSAEKTGKLVVQEENLTLPNQNNPQLCLWNGDGFIFVEPKLASDLSIHSDLTLGATTVLDLNGHTLTVAEGKGVNVGSNARIIDSSAEKTGKLVMDEGELLIANPNNPQLPLYTGDGYILTEPQLGDSRAFFVDGSVSANGFTLDFRPGFGAVGGKNVREEYLANGSCGITMDAQLSWTDIFGVNGSAKLACDSVFTGMYENANRRGRLALTGAEKYQTISLSIALSSCGVVKTFDLPTFSNEDRMTIHVAVQSDVYEKTSSGNGNTYPFNAPIDTTTANKLVLEFGLQVTDANSESPLNECFGFRMTPAQAYCDTGSYNSGYYFGLYGAGFNPGQRLVSTCDSTLCRVDSVDTAEKVNYKLELNIATGVWSAYENGVQVKSGTYPEGSYTTTAAGILNGVSSMFIRFQDAGNYNFSNMLLYSVKSGS